MSETAVAVGAWESLFRAQVTVMRELNACFPTDEISFNEYDVLFNLSNQPGRSARIRDLTRHLLLTQPSISRLVDRLASRGIVAKHSDPGDGRGIIVSMTDEGSALYRRTAVDHAAAIARRVGGSLGHDELVALTELCTRLRVGPVDPDETTPSPGGHHDEGAAESASGTDATA